MPQSKIQDLLLKVQIALSVVMGRERDSMGDNNGNS